MNCLVNFAEIRAMPTTAGGFHESCLRSFHVVQAIRTMMAAGWNNEAILNIVDDMMNSPQRDVIEPTKGGQ